MTQSLSFFLKPVLAVLLGLVLINAQAQTAAAVPDTIAQRTLVCAACHGKEGRATREGYFPRIAGKPAGYIYNQLVNFRDGRRRSQHMTYLVSHLSDDYLKEISLYFSSLHLPYPPEQPATVSHETLERGRVLVMNGDPARQIPACTRCHGSKLTGVQPSIPGLLGLPRDYLNGQFGAWRSGIRKAAAPDCMADIAHKLNVDDISALSAWLAAQPVPADMRPLAAKPAKLPLRCGSFEE